MPSNQLNLGYLNLEILECGQCGDHLTPPIFQCKNGHVICSPCRGSMNAMCHSCSDALDARCIALEGIVMSLQVPCMFGCGHFVSFTNPSSHESECTYAIYACPVTGCGFKGMQEQFSEHFNVNHMTSIIRSVNQTGFATTLRSEEPYRILEGNNAMFILQNTLREHGNEVSLMLVGPPSLESSYEYQIVVSKGKTTWMIRGTPYSIMRGTANPVYLFIPLELYQEDGHLLFTITFITGNMSPIHV